MCVVRRKQLDIMKRSVTVSQAVVRMSVQYPSVSAGRRISVKMEVNLHQIASFSQKKIAIFFSGDLEMPVSPLCW